MKSTTSQSHAKRSMRRYGVFALVALITAGCSNAKRQVESSDNLKQLSLAIIQYHDTNKAWPDNFDQIKSMVGKQGPLGVIGNGKDAATLMKNPLTGENPGYEYAKPQEDNAGSSAIVLYQLRDGKRDMTLPVAFADGSVRPADSKSP